MQYYRKCFKVYENVTAIIDCTEKTLENPAFSKLSHKLTRLINQEIYAKKKKKKTCYSKQLFELHNLSPRTMEGLHLIIT